MNLAEKPLDQEGSNIAPSPQLRTVVVDGGMTVRCG
jgi:hypothetical protein